MQMDFILLFKLMLHSVDNWLTISLILLTLDLTFLLLLVWFLGLCRIPEKNTRKQSEKLFSISRVPLILVSNIVEVHIHFSVSPTPNGMAIVMIGSPLMAMCFTSTLDRWFGRARNIRHSLCGLHKHNIVASFMQVQSDLNRGDNDTKLILVLGHLIKVIFIIVGLLNLIASKMEISTYEDLNPN
jgi:hypothetical protein